MAVLADSEMIVGDGTTDPVAESGATLRTSIGVGTGDAVEFAGITGTGLDINGAADISGDLTLSAGADGALRFSVASSVKILDNSATSLVFEEADNAYLTFDTGNSSESILFTGASYNMYWSKSSSSGSLILNDNAKLKIGTGGDTELYYDGTNTLWNLVADGSGYLGITGNTMVANGYGMVIGHTAQETISIDGSTDLVPEFQILGTGAADASMMLAAFSTTATIAGSPILGFVKSGDAAIDGTHVVVTDGEELGNIVAYGDDGTDLESIAAQIQFEVDGSPGTGDMPGRIVFATTADGSQAASEAMRIDSSQNVGIGNAIPTSFHANAENLVVGSGSGSEGITIYSGTSSVGALYFSDGTGAPYQGYIEYSHSTDKYVFGTAAATSMSLSGGTTAVLTIGSAAAVDTAIVFDGNAVDYHIGLDDTADALVIGTGSTLGSGTSMVFGSTEGRVAIGNNSDAGGQIGVAANTGIHSDWNFGDIGNVTHQGFNMTTRATQTGASGSGAVRHLFQSGVRTGSDQNWTGTPGVAGVATYLFTESSSSGVVTDMRDIWVMTGAAGGATVTNKYGIYIEDQTLGTNDYGLYIAGADTYALWVDADPCRFDDDILVENGGHIGIQDNTPTEAELVITNSDNAATTLMKTTDAGGTGAHTHWDINNTNGQVGTVNTSGSTTSFNTSSDYRLKENIVDLTGAINRVKELKPKRFNFKADATETFDGFLAHEAAEVVPISVTGTKDEMDGSDPVYQGMDSSKLVPLLTAAIKELEARVTALE